MAQNRLFRIGQRAAEAAVTIGWRSENERTQPLRPSDRADSRKDPLTTHRANATNESSRRALLELVEALDRRVPQVERSGEAAIAREATRLRAEASERLAELDRAARRRTDREAATADAVMSDDGAPAACCSEAGV